MAKTNAERAREYRARKREERLAAEAAERDARDAAAPTTMSNAIAASISAMKWIKDSDGASVAQAVMIAELIDLATHAGEHSLALSAHGKLSRVLHDLGGTPAVRMQRELRSGRLPAVPETPTATAAAIDAAPNVTRLKRPAKRSR